MEGMCMHTETLILGAGPAGLQLGHHLAKAGRGYLILEAGDSPGTFFKTFPRHRTLISSNKINTGYDDAEINLRWDWNSLLSDGGELRFKEYSRQYFPPADRLVDYLADFAQCHDLNIRYHTRIERIEPLEAGSEGYRLLDTAGNAFTCRRLIVAAGFTKPYVPDIPGVELAESYVDVSVNPDDFANQKVMIVGKGNSAFETADNLIATAAVIHVCSPETLNLAWKTHFVGHLRAVNNNFLDTYQLKSQNAVLDATIERIHRREDGKLVAALRYSHACGETEEIAYDRIILCTGFRFDNTIFAEGSRPAMTLGGTLPAMTSAWESTNLPGVYFAGTLTQALDYKKGTSGFIHGFRYNVRTLALLLEERYHGSPLPCRPVEPTAEAMTAAALARINRSSALWQQFGILHDLIVLAEDGGPARYYEELSLGLIQDTALGAVAPYFTVALEFGKVTGDPFAIERAPVVDRARESIFLHPVIRHWNGRTLLAEYHLLEDLDGEWTKPEAHLEPLREFFAGQLRESVPVMARL